MRLWVGVDGGLAIQGCLAGGFDAMDALEGLNMVSVGEVGG